LVQALGFQGAQIDFLKIVNRILETYDERDVESFVIDEAAKPENQVAQAITENQQLQESAMSGMPNQVKVMPTDNHKLHIILHGLMGGEFTVEHIAEHQAAMAAQVPGGSPGGGNAEGLPVNGVAVNQEQMREPLRPNATNQKTAVAREAGKPTATR
jgi:hypothetical protein